jgi:hypothetical protein
MREETEIMDELQGLDGYAPLLSLKTRILTEQLANVFLKVRLRASRPTHIGSAQNEMTRTTSIMTIPPNPRRI